MSNEQGRIVSPDGGWYWDGQAWQPTDQTGPARKTNRTLPAIIIGVVVLVAICCGVGTIGSLISHGKKGADDQGSKPLPVASTSSSPAAVVTPSPTLSPSPTPPPPSSSPKASPTKTATKTSTPTPKKTTTTKPASNCNPNYTPCVPNASDVDCAGGSGNGPVYVTGPVWVIGQDVYGLDTDHDGIGCE